MSSAGKFEIEISGPYPCWGCIKYQGKDIARVRHTEFSDLKYAVEKAMQEAALQGDDIRREVYP